MLMVKRYGDDATLEAAGRADQLPGRWRYGRLRDVAAGDGARLTGWNLFQGRGVKTIGAAGRIDRSRWQFDQSPAFGIPDAGLSISRCGRQGRTCRP